MIRTHANNDFTTIYRPRRISEVYGNGENKEIIARGLNEGTLPHALLFHGVSGTGKTTLARIVGMGLNCKTGRTSEPCCECDSCRFHLYGTSFAYVEYNSANNTGIDFLRGERQNFDALPLGGYRAKVYVFDECHRLTENAQDLLLREVEDPVDITYFIFCTTKLGGIMEPLKNRCLSLEFTRIADPEIMRLLKYVSASEQLSDDSQILGKIVEQSNGMPRSALILLQRAMLAGEIRPKQQAIEAKMRMLRAMGSWTTQDR